MTGLTDMLINMARSDEYNGSRHGRISDEEATNLTYGLMKEGGARFRLDFEDAQALVKTFQEKWNTTGSVDKIKTHTDAYVNTHTEQPKQIGVHKKGYISPEGFANVDEWEEGTAAYDAQQKKAIAASVDLSDVSADDVPEPATEAPPKTQKRIAKTAPEYADEGGSGGYGERTGKYDRPLERKRPVRDFFVNLGNGINNGVHERPWLAVLVGSLASGFIGSRIQRRIDQNRMNNTFVDNSWERQYEDRQYQQQIDYQRWLNRRRGC